MQVYVLKLESGTKPNLVHCDWHRHSFGCFTLSKHMAVDKMYLCMDPPDNVNEISYSIIINFSLFHMTKKNIRWLSLAAAHGKSLESSNNTIK